MALNITINQDEKTIALEGRLDTITAPELEKAIEKMLDNVDSLILDFKNLVYISSAGLRVILKTYKKLETKKGLQLINVSNEVKEVFEITGFSDFLNIK